MIRSLTPSGYVPCACRDCFEIAIGTPGALCHTCDDAGCNPDRECQGADAYGGEPDPPSERPTQPAPGSTIFHALVAHQGFAVITEGTSHPRTVIERLLAALRLLAPAAHAQLTAPGGVISTIPEAALARHLHPYWDGDDATEVVMIPLMTALDAAAPPGSRFCCEGDACRLGFFS